MPILPFDQKELLRQLNSLPNPLRAAFAAACAQRQVDSYVRFSKVAKRGNPEILIRALNRLWDDLEGRTASANELRQQAEACMDLLPDEDDYFDGLAYYAEDAVSSAVYAIESRLKSDAQQAIWASQRAHDALHEFASAEEPDARYDQKEEARIHSHLLVQAELNRQQADLQLLGEITTGAVGEAEGLAAVRKRAQLDASRFLSG